jgi:hypothetical protein
LGTALLFTVLYNCWIYAIVLGTHFLSRWHGSAYGIGIANWGPEIEIITSGNSGVLWFLTWRVNSGRSS